MTTAIERDEMTTINGIIRDEADARAAIAALTGGEGEFALFYAATNEGRITLHPLPVRNSLATWWAAHGENVSLLFCYRKGTSWMMPDDDMVKEVLSDFGGIALHIQHGNTRVSDKRIAVSFARATIVPPGAKIDGSYVWLDSPLLLIDPTTGLMSVVLAT